MRPAPKAWRKSSLAAPGIVLRCGRRGLPLHEESVNQTAKCAADQRAEPINVMIVPKIRRQSGPENARRIHGCASERPAKQNIESDCRSDGKTSDPASPFVHSSAIDNKDEEKCQDPLDQNSLSRIEIDGKLGRSGDDHLAP